MEQLCSSNIADVKKLLDLTANDYGLNELCYIPSVAASPFLCASNFIHEKIAPLNSLNEQSSPPVYFIPWGFVKHSNVTTTGFVKLPENESALAKVERIVVDRLKDKKEGLFMVTNLIESIVECDASLPLGFPQVDAIILKIIYAEFLRKQGFVDKSIEIL